MNTHIRLPGRAAIIVGILAFALAGCSRLAAQQALEQGNTKFSDSEWEAAITAYDEAISFDADLYEAYGNRGLSYANLGDYEAAIADFNAFIERNDQDANIYFARGSVFLELGEFKAAREDFTRALELNPGLVKASYERARAAIALNDAGSAAADLERVQALDPERDISAEQALVEMMEGDAHYTQGEMDDALAHYTTVIDIGSNSLAFSSRGNVHLAQGDYEGAIADYTAALVDNPDFVDPYAHRCEAYFQVGNLEEGLADCSRAIEMIHSDPEACEECSDLYFWRGSIYAALGYSQAVIDDFNAYLELDSQNATAYYLRGAAYADLGDYTSALADFSRAIEADPTLANAYCDRARYEVLSEGDLVQALDDANKAIELTPEPTYFDTRGLIYYKTGQYDLSLEDYGLAIGAGHPYSYYGRGLVNEALGETESAVNDFTDFLEAYPDREPESNDARQQLLVLNPPPWGYIRVEPGQPIQIAVLGPTSGLVVSLGEALRQAAQLAVEDFGPVQGFEVLLVPERASCDYSGGATAVARVLNNPAIVGVIGPVCSSSARGGLPALERAHVVLISPTATLADLPLSGPTVFNRVVPYDGQPGSEGWEEIANGLASVQTFYITYQSRTGLNLPSDGPFFVAYSYDAVALLLNALEQIAWLDPDGGLIIERQALAMAVRATAGYEGLTGPITLEPDGDRMP